MLVLHILLGTVILTALSMVFALRSLFTFSGSRSAVAESRALLRSDLSEFWERKSKSYISQTCLFLAAMNFLFAFMCLTRGHVEQYSFHSNPIAFLSCVGYWIALGGATLIVGLRIY